MALVVWAVRLPLLVILVASYSCMPRAWPQQVSSAHYAAVGPQSEGETEEEAGGRALAGRAGRAGGGLDFSRR